MRSRGFGERKHDMNNKGRGVGLALLVILIAALLAALLAVRSISSPGLGGSRSAQVEQENLVRQTQEVVDQLNQRQRQSVPEP